MMVAAGGPGHLSKLIVLFICYTVVANDALQNPKSIKSGASDDGCPFHSIKGRVLV